MGDIQNLRNLRIVDGTLREGEQTPGVFFTPEEKLAIARALDRAGVAILDAGMPSVSEEERETLTVLCRENLNASIGVSARMTGKDVTLAAACGADEVFLICPVSSGHMHDKLGMDSDRLLLAMDTAVKQALDLGLGVNLVAEDATRGDPSFVSRVAGGAWEAGARRVFLCDTVGTAHPAAIKSLVAAVKLVCPAMAVGVHCHDDLGLATANTLAAIEAGAELPAVTINGIGERAGNAPLQEVVVAAEKLLGHSSGVDATRLGELSAMVESCSGILVPPHTPIVGFNAFRHESGIHVDGLLKNRDTYTGVAPEAAGSRETFVLGKHTGTGTIQHLLAREGVDADEDELVEILKRTKAAKTARSKDHIRKMIREVHAFHRESLDFPRDEFMRIVTEVKKKR